jgi:hypothetical protein
MSARKAGQQQGSSTPITVKSSQTTLVLTPEAVSLHKSGIEFFSQTSFPQWVEMTVALQSPHSAGTVNCSGVVVNCMGNKHAGYHVSMVFTSLTKQAESRLHSMLFTRAS